MIKKYDIDASAKAATAAVFSILETERCTRIGEHEAKQRLATKLYFQKVEFSVF